MLDEAKEWQELRDSQKTTAKHARSPTYPSYCLFTLEPYIMSFVYLHRNTYKMAVKQSMLHYKKHKPMQDAV